MFEALQNESPLARLMERGVWGEDQPLLDELKSWEQFPLFTGRFLSLRREALFKSTVHGHGHIERVMLLGALLAMKEGLSSEDTALLMDMCAYHDVGRVSDWLDEYHGSRSCYRLEELTGQSGEELKLIMAGVEAHSRRDGDMDEVIAKYAPADPDRCKRLAILLKDADGLDRVRIGDLDPDFMRTPSARELVPFSGRLFKAYSAVQEEMGQEPVRRSFVDKVVLEQMRDLVQSRLVEQGEDAAVTVLRGLSELFDMKLEPQLFQAAVGMSGAGGSGAQCGIVEGALLFLGAYYGSKGLAQEKVVAICREFAAAFTDKWGSLRCGDLRPGGVHPDDPPSLCAGLTMEGILFTREFILGKR